MSVAPCIEMGEDAERAGQLFLRGGHGPGTPAAPGTAPLPAGTGDTQDIEMHLWSLTRCEPQLQKWKYCLRN